MRVVLISGGSRGLGAGLVEHFLHLGDQVASFSRSNSEQVSAWLTEYPDRFMFECGDITDREALAAFLEEVQERFRLACQTRPLSDCQVMALPPKSRTRNTRKGITMLKPRVPMKFTSKTGKVDTGVRAEGMFGR